MSTQRGTVASLKLEKGFGFISVAAAKRMLFFHIKSLDRSLPFDATLMQRRVEFEVFQTENGPRAENVRPAH